MNITAYQIDAFTEEPFGGNPAMVVIEADELSDDIMQLIASEIYLSETTFIKTPESMDSSFRFRFFTNSEEIDMSGHALIASCYILIAEGRILLDDGITKVYVETNIGIVPVNIHFSKTGLSDNATDRNDPLAGIAITGGNTGILEKIMIHQEIHRHRPSDIPVDKIVDILGIDEREIINTGLPLEIVSTGIETLLLPIASKETILNINPDLIRLNQLNKLFGIQSNHLFSLDTFCEDCITYSRDFIPSLGMWEDPASGTSSAALGTYLIRHGIPSSGSMIMEQGNDKGSLARILVESSNSENTAGAVWIGGLAALSIKRNIVVEDNMVTIA
ncbi:MAG: PhzF family phenazine biosynthesis protein [Candidatus Krumholzibacteria bacterium]|nr:PhzF family phenazine biosynthesis protein [Candidatus Krumholzibacteria bacterium]